MGKREGKVSCKEQKSVRSEQPKEELRSQGQQELHHTIAMAGKDL